jgi:DNA-binding NarL/FixJ family response regulator
MSCVAMETPPPARLRRERRKPADPIVPDVFGGDASGFAARVARLSRMQRFVLAQVACGRLNKQIAFDAGLAEATVKSHVTEILRRLGTRSRTEAAVKYAVLMDRFGDRSAVG